MRRLDEGAEGLDALGQLPHGLIGAASYDDTGIQVQIVAALFAPGHGTAVNVRGARPAGEDEALVEEVARMLRDEGAGPLLPSG